MNDINNESVEVKTPFLKRPLLLLILCFLILVFVGIGYFSFQKDKNSTLTNNIASQNNWQYFQNLGYINDIAFDSNKDVIWLADNGIHKFSQSQNKIIKSYNVSDGLLSNQVLGLEKIGGDLYFNTTTGIGKIKLEDGTVSTVYNGIPEKGLNEGESSEIHGFVSGLDYDGKNLVLQTTISLKKFNLETKEWETFDYNFRAGMPQILSLKNSVQFGDKIFAIYNRQLWESDENTKKWIFDPSVVIQDGTAGIKSNGKYLVIGPPFNFYHKEPVVLYYRSLADSKWTSVTLPFSEQPDQGTRYGGMSIDKNNNIYFIDDYKELIVYNLETKNIKKYPFGSDFPSGGSLSELPIQQTYVDTENSKVFFRAPFSNNFGIVSVDLKTGKISTLLDKENTLSYDKVLSAHNGKAVVNTNKGIGILTPETNDFKLISNDITYDTEAKWVSDNIVWLNLSPSQQYESNCEDFDDDGVDGCVSDYYPPNWTFTLGKYNVESNYFEKKDFTVKNDSKELFYKTQLFEGQTAPSPDEIYFVDSQNKLRLVNFSGGTIQEKGAGNISKINPQLPFYEKSGMMSLDFDQSILDGKCVWFSKELEGIWRYCQK